MNQISLSAKGFLALGVLAAIGLVGYGLTYVVVMPQVSPQGFVPQTLGTNAGAPSGFSLILAVFVLIYAFAFLPVNVLFTIKHYRTNPYALVLACCLVSISSVIEILNSLPLVASGLYPGKLETIPAELALYLRQTEAIRWLSFDVAGFALIYAALFVYALVYFRSNRLLAYTSLGSIVLFVANVPFLWLASNLAVILMVLSILVCAVIPVLLARMALE